MTNNIVNIANNLLSLTQGKIFVIDNFLNQKVYDPKFFITNKKSNIGEEKQVSSFKLYSIFCRHYR